jgi:hypothetical protein
MLKFSTARTSGAGKELLKILDRELVRAKRECAPTVVANDTADGIRVARQILRELKKVLTK